MKDMQAFPISGSQYRHTEGMTLRDYFAAKAMQGSIAGTPHNVDIEPTELATWCYIMADAMLKAKGE